MKFATTIALLLVAIMACGCHASANTLRGSEAQDSQARETKVTADTMTTYFISLDAVTKPKLATDLTSCVPDTIEAMLQEWSQTDVEGKIVELMPPTLTLGSGGASTSSSNHNGNRRRATTKTKTKARECTSYFCVIQAIPSCRLCGRRELGSSKSDSSESSVEVAALANMIKFSLPKICSELGGASVQVTKTVTYL